MQESPHTDTTTIKALSVAAAQSAKMVLITTLVGGLIGLALYHFHQPRWTAKMLVKLGQVTTFVDSGPSVRPLESQMTAVEQMNQPAYRLNVLKDLGLPAPDGPNDDATLIFNSLRTAPGRGADLLALQVNAHSPELAKRALSASFSLIEREHRKRYNAVVDRMTKDLTDTNAKLAVAEQEYSKAYGALKATERPDSSGTRDLFTTNIVATVSRQIIDLQRRKTQFENSLESAQTYSTRIMDAPYVPPKPSSPGRTVFVGLGALAGLLAGTVLFMLIRIRK